MSLNKAIFYIKYYAKKHDMVIERKATLDENCFEGHHKKFGYPYKKYIDEAIEFAKESGFALNDAELIRTNSTGLVMYNPKNAAAMLKSMKNKSQSREQTIADRLIYNKSQAVN